MTKAFDKALSILQSKGESLTDADVKEIDFLSSFFDFKETVEEKPYLYEVIDQVRMRPESELSPDGRT